MTCRYFVGFVMGAVFGPVAYLGAEQLGAVTVGDGLSRTLAITGLAAEWAIMMPVLLWLAARIGGRR